MERTLDYASTLRLPKTGFPMRRLPLPCGGNPRADDVATMLAAGVAGGPCEAYRRTRNVLRFMLGCLAWRSDGAADARALEPLECHFASLMREGCRASAPLAAVAFVTGPLQGFWLDARKDALYCDTAASPRRLSAMAFLEAAFETALHAVEPVAPRLCAEAWEAWKPENPFPGEPHSLLSRAPAPPPGWAAVAEVRDSVLAELERARVSGAVDSSSMADVTVRVGDPALMGLLRASAWDPCEVLGTAAVRVLPVDGGPRLAVAVAPAEGRVCARSRRVSADLGADPRWPDLSARDAAAVEEFLARASASG